MEGVLLSSTPFSSATYESAVPKSVRRVINDGEDGEEREGD
jgi:hypothetical protein